MVLRTLSLLCLVGLAGCSAAPPPARPRMTAAMKYFSPSAELRGLMLDFENRGVESKVLAKTQRVVGTAARGSGVELLEEKDLEEFRDVDTRGPLVGEQTDADLGRVALTFGAQRVFAGWVGQNGKVRAFDLRIVDARGHRLNHAAGFVRDDDAKFYVAVRAATRRMLQPDPDMEGPWPMATLMAGLKRRRGFFDSCLAEAAMANENLNGRALVEIRVKENGAVNDANVTGSTFGDAGLDLCLLRAGERLQFPSGAEGLTKLIHSVSAEPPADPSGSD